MVTGETYCFFWSSAEVTLIGVRPVVKLISFAMSSWRNALSRGDPVCNCIKIGLPGKPILRDYFQENKTSQRPFLLLRINFPGRPIFLQLPPDYGSGTIIDSVSVPSDIEPGQYVVSFRWANPAWQCFLLFQLDCTFCTQYRAGRPICRKVLRIKFGWLADTVATYCPGRPSQLTWKNIT